MGEFRVRTAAVLPCTPGPIVFSLSCDYDCSYLWKREFGASVPCLSWDTEESAWIWLCHFLCGFAKVTLSELQSPTGNVE